MILPLTLDQIAVLKAHLKPGKVLVAKITREAFAGLNAATSGTPFIEFAAMPAAVMPALRKAVEATLAAKPKRAKKIPTSKETEP